MHTLPSPLELQAQLPPSKDDLAFVQDSRFKIRRTVQGKDSKILVIVGPCSIHDTKAALEYAVQLKKLSNALKHQLTIAMRVYCQKPRSHYGWKGLINDPYCDESFDVNAGLYRARKLMLDITKLQLPIATEWLDPFTLPYLSDLVSWGAIGARTAESQIHREIASLLSMPLGFKNNPDGNVKVAIDGIRSAQKPHTFLGLSLEGKVTTFCSKGNPDLHLVLRGSKLKSNYGVSDIKQAELLLHHYQLPVQIMVDCSHGNSAQDPVKQVDVVKTLIQQGSFALDSSVFGIMLESFLLPGRQDMQQRPLRYGQSLTDGCLSWLQTEKILQQLAAVLDRNACQSRIYDGVRVY